MPVSGDGSKRRKVGPACAGHGGSSRSIQYASLTDDTNSYCCCANDDVIPLSDITTASATVLDDDDMDDMTNSS